MKKSARLNQFLNVGHGFVTRLVAGSALFTFALVATGEPALAREMFQRAYKKDQFRIAFRRASFLARRSWLKLNFSNDAVYVFCDGLLPEQLKAMRRFLIKRQKHHPPGLVAGDLQYVSAALVIQTFGQPEYAENLATYARDTNNVLQAIQSAPAQDTSCEGPEIEDTFDVEKAAHALKDFSTFMDEQNVTWFVLSGTLLGAVRQRDFLPHDDDIDIGIEAASINVDEFVSRLRKNPNFHCGDLDSQVIFTRDDKGQMRLVKKPVFIKIGHHDGIHIDVFFHHTEGDISWCGSSLFRWDNSAFELQPYELAGLMVQGPKDADRYLTENYGNWRVPVKSFQSALDTTNQQVVANPLSIAIFLRRIWLEKRRKPDSAVELLRMLSRQGYIDLQTNTCNTEYFGAKPS